MRLIDADKLFEIEKLLDTDVIRKSKTASFLLDQVLFDISHMPTIRKLDELYTQFIAVTGMTAEEILNKFKQGYVLEKTEYPTLSEVFKEEK